MSEAAKQEETKPTRSLVKKLAEVKATIGRIAKNGHNDHFGYDFATEADIVEAVRGEMASRSLMMFPSVKDTTWEKIPRKNGETKLCTLTVEFTVEDGESGETRSFTIMGQGEDSVDKATYKAMTGAEKYALLKLFMIPTGDDPEKDSEHRYTPNQQAPAPRPAANTAPPGPRDASTKIPYGKSKGKYLADVDAEDLTWLLGAAKKSVEANDPKWHAKNQAWLKAVQDETGRRITNATGKVTAPAQSSPRTAKAPQQELPMDDEGPTVFAQFKALAAEFGTTPQKLAGRCKGVLGGKDMPTTPQDIAALRGALQAVPPGRGES